MFFICRLADETLVHVKRSGLQPMVGWWIPFFFGHFCCCCLYMACVCGRFWWLFNGTAKFFFFICLIAVEYQLMQRERQTSNTFNEEMSQIEVQSMRQGKFFNGTSLNAIFISNFKAWKKKLINWFWPKNGCDFDWFICLVHFNSISNASPLHRDL